MTYSATCYLFQFLIGQFAHLFPLLVFRFLFQGVQLFFVFVDKISFSIIYVIHSPSCLLRQMRRFQTPDFVKTGRDVRSRTQVWADRRRERIAPPLTCFNSSSVSSFSLLFNVSYSFFKLI